MTQENSNSSVSPHYCHGRYGASYRRAFGRLSRVLFGERPYEGATHFVSALHLRKRISS